MSVPALSRPEPGAAMRGTPRRWVLFRCETAAAPPTIEDRRRGRALSGDRRRIAGPGCPDGDHDGVDSSLNAPPSDEVGTLDGTDLDVTQGRNAVEQLERTGTLDDVADEVGLDPAELREELLHDSSMFLTDTGFVGYADTAEWSPAPPTAPLAVAELPANVFDLNSRPTSSRVIYLDFDGHTANDPAWASVGFPVIASAPFDIDGIPGSFSAVEQALIYEVWQRVAEDYRAFDVNITTREPGIEGIRRTSTVDAGYGQRVVVTPTNFAGGSVIGVALLDVFGSDADHAAYVFTDLGFKQTAKTMAEAVSHEAGHTFGLSHDGGPLNPNYYDGHGEWAPIMGRPIDRPVSQWSRGEYAGANNFEDDLSIIANGKNGSPGAGHRPDDHGNTAGAPTVVPSNGVASGNIGHTGDRDVFAVDVLDGTLSVQLRPPTGQASWSNLAAAVTVRDSLGNVIASGTPDVASGWTIDLAPAVLSGRYTIEVEPVGWLTASTGFTLYGSLGAYEVAITAPQGPTPLPPGTSAFTPVTPVRLVDTRNSVGAVGRVAAGRQVVVQVADGVRVPADATAAVVNVAAVNPSAPGFLLVYPCSEEVPDTSTLNYVAGQTVANTTIAALSSAGQLCAWTFAETDILVDITGWLSPRGASRLTPIGPTRVVDTRSNVGGVRLAAGQTLAVDLNGVVPAGSNAVAVNVTAVNAATAGFLTVFPCSGAPPNTSTVNYVADEARPNNTIVGLSGGRVCVFSDAATDVLVDLLGSFSASGLGYQPTAPVRVLDTRRTGTLVAGSVAAYSVAAAGLGAQVPGAAYVNVTAANHTVDGFVTTYDCVTRRDTSTLNQKVGQATANGAIVPLSALQSCGWMFGGGDLIVDLNGWWVP